jgi:hypothetical protein
MVVAQYTRAATGRITPASSRPPSAAADSGDRHLVAQRKGQMIGEALRIERWPQGSLRRAFLRDGLTDVLVVEVE